MISITHRIASVVLTLMMLIPFASAALAQRNDDFYRGAQRNHPYNDDYDRHHYRDDRHHGGIGPGKGALIGGAAGAGVGALVGKAHQDNRDRDYRDRPY